MNIEVAKSVVSDMSAKIFSGKAVDTKGAEVFVRFWEHIRPGEIENASEYLRKYVSEKNGFIPSSFVENLKVEKTTLYGIWRNSVIDVKREKDGTASLFQTLSKGLVQTVKEDDNFDFSEFLTEDGDLWPSGAEKLVLRLPNVDPSKVNVIREELKSGVSFDGLNSKYESFEGVYYYINATQKAEDDGGISILLTLAKMPTNPLYIINGQKKTALFAEEDRVYRGIPFSCVESLISSITVLGNYSLVRSDASRQSSSDGIFDVSLTVRTMLTPPGGSDVLIGITGGMFRTQVRMLRNVKDVDLEGTVTALSQTNLIENVRATGGREDGVWDIVYSLLLVPASHIDRYEYYERAQNRREDTDYNYFFKWVPYISNVVPKNTNPQTYTLTNDYQKQVDRVPTAFKESADKQFRKVSVEKTISYGATFNNVSYPACSISGTTTTSGKTFQLSNGIWQKEVEVITYDWWPDPQQVSPQFT